MIFITNGIKLEENVKKKSSKASAKRTGVGEVEAGRGGEEAGSPSSPLALFIDTQLRPASALIKKLL